MRCEDNQHMCSLCSMRYEAREVISMGNMRANKNKVNVATCCVVYHRQLVVCKLRVRQPIAQPIRRPIDQPIGMDSLVDKWGQSAVDAV